VLGLESLQPRGRPVLGLSVHNDVIVCTEQNPVLVGVSLLCSKRLIASGAWSLSDDVRLFTNDGFLGASFAVMEQRTAAASTATP
jgi:hypothetical protein